MTHHNITTLPLGMKLLLKTQQRAMRLQQVDMFRNELCEPSLTRSHLLARISHCYQPQAKNIRACGTEAFDGTYKQEFYHTGRRIWLTPHQVECPSPTMLLLNFSISRCILDTINRREGDKCAYGAASGTSDASHQARNFLLSTRSFSCCRNLIGTCGVI